MSESFDKGQGDAPGTEPPFDDEGGDRDRGGLSDFVRRAVAAGFGAASGSKDALVRVLAGEVRNWLDHMDLDSEIVRALSKMTIEVKAEMRFRPNEQGKLVPETVSSEARLRQEKPQEPRAEKPTPVPKAPDPGTSGSR